MIDADQLCTSELQSFKESRPTKGVNKPHHLHDAFLYIICQSTLVFERDNLVDSKAPNGCRILTPDANRVSRESTVRDEAEKISIQVLVSKVVSTFKVQTRSTSLTVKVIWAKPECL